MKKSSAGLPEKIIRCRIVLKHCSIYQREDSVDSKNKKAMGVYGMTEQVLERKEALRRAVSNLEIDENYRIVGREALKNNIKVRTVFLPQIVEIRGQAFYNCTNLRKVGVPNLSTIRKEAFSGCSNLRTVSFPSAFSQMEDSAFYGCKRLGKVEFEKNNQVQRLPNRVFSECKELSALIMSDSLEEIGREAFYKCGELKTLHLPEHLKRIAARAFYASGLTELELPGELSDIGEGAFLKCKALEYVRVPETVKTIGKWAFHGCSRLKVLEVPRDPEVIGEWITNKNCVIRCPKGSRMEAYANEYGMEIEYL